MSVMVIAVTVTAMFRLLDLLILGEGSSLSAEGLGF
jgi:hypothetical protein